MSKTGESENLLIQARTVLVDALIALDAHRDSVVVIGAQAVYLHTGSATVAVAEATKDSDLGIDVRSLGEDPLIEEAMTRAGFLRDPVDSQPGAWMSPSGVPVDLMVPEAIAGGRGRRSVSAPPHDKQAMRRAAGLEAAVVDNTIMTIRALDPSDDRAIEARVAGPFALLVSKLHKLGERQASPDRLRDKDAYDVYRLLTATPLDVLASSAERLLLDDLASAATETALVYLAALFGTADATGAFMAGRAEELVGNPDVVAASCAALAGDLLTALDR